MTDEEIEKFVPVLRKIRKHEETILVGIGHRDDEEGSA